MLCHEKGYGRMSLLAALFSQGCIKKSTRRKKKICTFTCIDRINLGGRRFILVVPIAGIRRFHE